MSRDSEASRKKILRVAEKLFAKKGFDGARVDEIAKEAKVNKALIYYYFKGKSAILSEIFSEFQREATDLLFQHLTKTLDLSEFQTSTAFFDLYLDFLEARKNTLRIMLTESLKSSDSDPPLFNLMNAYLTAEVDTLVERFKEKGFNLSDKKEQLMVTEFFTGIMPIFNYIVFKDKWCRFFQVTRDELRSAFIEAYRATHIAYHLSQKDQLTTGP